LAHAAQILSEVHPRAMKPSFRRGKVGTACRRDRWRRLTLIAILRRAPEADNFLHIVPKERSKGLHKNN
jgi:hypothetical protein